MKKPRHALSESNELEYVEYLRDYYRKHYGKDSFIEWMDSRLETIDQKKFQGATAGKFVSSTVYSVRRIKRDMKAHGPHHGSRDGYSTVCGKSLDDGWYITHNNYDGPITCRACRFVLREEQF